jgi:hypothetical protein
MAASNINLDATIQASFSGIGWVFEVVCMIAKVGRARGWWICDQDGLWQACHKLAHLSSLPDPGCLWRVGWQVCWTPFLAWTCYIGIAGPGLGSPLEML